MDDLKEGVYIAIPGLPGMPEIPKIGLWVNLFEYLNNYNLLIL